MEPRITALVPTFNEAERIEDTLRSLRAGGLESIVVVDGGSGDGTRELAARHAARVLEAERGLAGQLDLAVREARGDVLLFHYADVLFPRGGVEAILKALEQREVVGGAFSLALDSRRLCYRLITLGTRARNGLGIGPFGDQSLFVRSEVYRRIGGFRARSVHPDLDLVRRLRREGRFLLLKEQVVASVRRWERNGVLRTSLQHAWLTALLVLGARRAGERAARAADTIRTVR